MIRVYSANAKEGLNAYIENIDETLRMIQTEMEKYKSLQRVHYGHVVDLAYINEQLIQIWEFVSETK